MPRIKIYSKLHVQYNETPFMKLFMYCSYLQVHINYKKISSNYSETMNRYYHFCVCLTIEYEY